MKLIKTASGKKSLKISRSEWESIGKTAGWRESDDLEPSKENKYMKDWEAYSKDSGSFSVHINEPGEKTGSFMGGPIFADGLDLFNEEIKKVIKEKYPYEENGPVTIEVSTHTPDVKKHSSFTWNTSLSSLENKRPSDFFSDIDAVVDAANSLNEEYNEYSKWQQQLEYEKDVRKGYYDDYYDDDYLQEEKKRQEKEKKQEKKMEESYMKPAPSVNTPFEDLALSSVKVKMIKSASGNNLQISKSDWKAIGKTAGWIE